MFSAINIVLVRPSQPRNIGSSARSMANMGAHKLILLDPQCEIDKQARTVAAGAESFFDKVVTYSSWEDFYQHEGEGVRVAFSRRGGKKRQVRDLREHLADYQEQKPSRNFLPLYLIFGPEDHGLNAEDLSFVHRTASLPTFGDFKSLNLAQAVMLALYITQDFLHKKQVALRRSEESSGMYFPDKTLRSWIEAIGFDISKRRMSAYLTVRRLLLQNWPSRKELMVLEAILQQNIRKLKEKA